MTSPPEPPTAAPDVAPLVRAARGSRPEAAHAALRQGRRRASPSLIAVVGVVGASITLPYVIFSPGDATPVDDYLKISDAQTYRHTGSLLLLTVRVSNGRPNVWRFLQASLDDDSKVEGEDDYFGGTPRKKVDKQDVAGDGRVAGRGAAGRARRASATTCTVTESGAGVQKVVQRLARGDGRAPASATSSRRSTDSPCSGPRTSARSCAPSPSAPTSRWWCDGVTGTRRLRSRARRRRAARSRASPTSGSGRRPWT